MSACTISFDPQNTIRCQGIKGKNSLSHSMFLSQTLWKFSSSGDNKHFIFFI